ncbi:MAG: ATP-binding protein, partial [Myxococcota bacterium]
MTSPTPTLFGAAALPSREVSVARAVAIAAASVGLVTAVKLAVPAALGVPTPFLLYFGAILASAWYGGVVAGAVATGAGAVLGALVFIGARDGYVPTVDGAVQMVAFAAEGAVVTWIVGRLRREIDRVEVARRFARHAEDRLSAVVEGVDEGITVIDRSGRLVFANAVAAKMSGFPSSVELLRATSDEVVARFELFDEAGAPFDPERLPARVLLRTGVPSEVTVRFRPRDAVEGGRWVTIRATPIHDPTGAIGWAISVFRDVSARREQLEALQLSREWFSTALNSIGDAVIATDRDGLVTFLNPIATALTGWTSADAVGRTLREVFPISDEATRQPVESPVERAIRENAVVGLADDTVLVRRDGTSVAIDDSAAPIRDPHGRLVGVVLVFRDVSQRRADELRRAFLVRATEELGSSLDYRTTLATVARLAVPRVADWCAVDVFEDGVLRRLGVAHVDPEKIRFVEQIQARYPADPTVDRGTWRVLRTGRSEWAAEIPDALLVASAQDAEHLALIRALMLRSYVVVPLTIGGERIGVLSFVMAESGRRHVEADLALAEALAERAGAAIDRARQYTRQLEAGRELEAARAEAERANRAKDEFLAMLGHEIRNPLAPIRTAVHLIALKQVPGIERERRVIERQVKHLVRLVDDLLDVSRIARGAIEIEHVAVEVDDVIARAIELTAPHVEERRHRLTVEGVRGLRVRGDVVRLAQVMANLLNNAAKYSEPEGTIAVTIAREEDPASDADRVVIRVRDRGRGIGPDQLPRVFDAFFQAEQGLDRAGGGLGLGLAIARRLVELHGGTIEAHSDGPGTGTEIVVALPSLDAAPTLPGPDADALTAQTAARVLVVDDNADAREILVDALRICGHRAVGAADGPSALVAAAELVPEVALLDIGLPVMDGYELAGRLRE